MPGVDDATDLLGDGRVELRHELPRHAHCRVQLIHVAQSMKDGVVLPAPRAAVQTCGAFVACFRIDPPAMQLGSHSDAGAQRRLQKLHLCEWCATGSRDAIILTCWWSRRFCGVTICDCLKSLCT